MGADDGIISQYYDRIFTDLLLHNRRAKARNRSRDFASRVLISCRKYRV